MTERTVRSAHGGFSLIEAVVATAIVALGMAGLLAGVSSGTRATHGGNELTQAVLLAGEMREFLLCQAFEDVTSYAYTQCVDGQGETIAGLDDWQQEVTVTHRLEDDLSQIDASGTSDLKYVRVDVLYKGRIVTTIGWLIARR